LAEKRRTQWIDLGFTKQTNNNRINSAEKNWSRFFLCLFLYHYTIQSPIDYLGVKRKYLHLHGKFALTQNTLEPYVREAFVVLFIFFISIILIINIL